MTKNRKNLLLVLACCLACFLTLAVACSTSPVLVEDIQVSYSNGNTLSGSGTLEDPYTVQLTGQTESATLTYTATPDSAEDKTILWRAVKVNDDNTVTPVSSSSVITIRKTETEVTFTRRANGEQYVAATSNDGNKEIIFKVTVDIPPVEVTSIEFNSNDNVYLVTAEEKANEESEFYGCDYNFAFAQGTLWNMSKGELDKAGMSHRADGETPDLSVFRYYPTIESFTLLTSANPADSTIGVKYYSDRECTNEVAVENLPFTFTVDNSSTTATSKDVAITVKSDSYGEIFAKVYAATNEEVSILVRIDVEQTYGGVVLASDFEEKEAFLPYEEADGYSAQTYWKTETEAAQHAGLTKAFIEDWRYYYLQAGTSVANAGSPEFYVWTLTDMSGNPSLAQGGVKFNNRPFGETSTQLPTDAVWNKVHIPSNATKIYAWMGSDNAVSEYRIRAIEPATGKVYVIRDWAALEDSTGNRYEVGAELQGELAELCGKNVILTVERRFTEEAGVNQFVSFNFSGLNIATSDNPGNASIGELNLKLGDSGTIDFTAGAEPVDSEYFTMIYADYYTSEWIPVSLTHGYMTARDDLLNINWKTGEFEVMADADTELSYRVSVAIIVGDTVGVVQKFFKIKDPNAIGNSAFLIEGITSVRAEEKANPEGNYYNADFYMQTRKGTYIDTAKVSYYGYAQPFIDAYASTYYIPVEFNEGFADAQLKIEYFSDATLRTPLQNAYCEMTVEKVDSLNQKIKVENKAAGSQWVKVSLEAGSTQYAVIKVDVQDTVIGGVTKDELDEKAAEPQTTLFNTRAYNGFAYESAGTIEAVLGSWTFNIIQTNQDAVTDGLGADWLGSPAAELKLNFPNPSGVNTEQASLVAWNVIRFPANSTMFNLQAGGGFNQGSAYPDSTRVYGYILTGDNKGETVVLRDWSRTAGYDGNATPGTNMFDLTTGDAAKLRGQDVAIFYEQRISDNSAFFVVFSGYVIGTTEQFIVTTCFKNNIIYVTDGQTGLNMNDIFFANAQGIIDCEAVSYSLEVQYQDKEGWWHWSDENATNVGSTDIIAVAADGTVTIGANASGVAQTLLIRVILTGNNLVGNTTIDCYLYVSPQA